MQRACHSLILAFSLAAALVPPAHADEIVCAEIQLDSFITSTGHVGVLFPTGIDGSPEYSEVQPGECFYDGALRKLKDMCSGFIDPSDGDPGDSGLPDWEEIPQMEDSSNVYTPMFGDAPKVDTVQNMRASIAKLKRQVRILRRKLYRRGR